MLKKFPTEAIIRQIVHDNQATVLEIEGVNPGLVGVDIETTSCPGKADLIIWYTSHQDRLAIEGIIGNDTFFGVPFRLQNRWRQTRDLILALLKTSSAFAGVVGAVMIPIISGLLPANKTRR